MYYVLDKSNTMPYVKNNLYRDLPFSSETPNGQEEFYVYCEAAELALKSKSNKEKLIRCRTVGVLQSVHGRFYLTDIDSPAVREEPMLRIFMEYLKNPPQSTVIPYPVQIFGTLQWMNGPVVYAKILQVLTAPMAIRIRDAMRSITGVHLAKTIENDDSEPT